MSKTPRTDERTRQIMRVVAESMVEGGSERGFALQDAARAAIETLEDELAVAVDGLSDGMPKWIPVDERLPEEGQAVLGYWPESTYYSGGSATVKFYPADAPDSSDVWFDGLGETIDRPTHWMPEPEAPK